jgi:hypothetical protein
MVMITQEGGKVNISFVNALLIFEAFLRMKNERKKITTKTGVFPAKLPLN